MPKKVYKSSETGKFVSASDAANNPATTYAQTTFNIDDALKAISERFDDFARAEFDDNQKVLRTASRLDPNSYESRIARAARQERDISEQITMLAQEPDSEAKQNRMYAALNRLSELLAEQGRYSEAIDVCPNSERRAHYQSILEALKKDDAETCHCPDEVVGELNSKAMMPMEAVVSEKHEKVVMLEKCRKCGFSNAR